MNQHSSRKRDLLKILANARRMLYAGDFNDAKWYLRAFWRRYAKAPASTRRRWKCGY